MNGADRIEKEISELRRRVHARKNKKMTVADRGRLLYSIQLLFRLDGINFKKRFKERFSRKTNWSRHPCNGLNTFFLPLENKESQCYSGYFTFGNFLFKRGLGPRKKWKSIKRSIGRMTDSMRRRIQIRLIIPLEPWARLESEYCEGRIPDVIHYSVEAWRSGKSRDFHRRTPTRGAQPLVACLSRQFLSWKGGNLPRLPRSEDFLSISRQDRKAHPAARGGYLPQYRRRASLLRLILDFLYTTRHGGDSTPCLDSDEYSLEEFITSIYARVSNSYPGRSPGTIEPTDVYPSPLPRILAGSSSFLRKRLSPAV